MSTVVFFSYPLFGHTNYGAMGEHLLTLCDDIYANDLDLFD